LIKILSAKGNQVLYKSIIAFILCAVFLTTFLTPSAGATPDDYWEQTFGGAGEDEAYSVVQTDDGGFVFTGSYTDTGLGKQHVYLVKTDAAGDKLWEWKYGDGGFHEVGRSLQQTADGGFIITGISRTTNISNDKIYLIKTNSLGELEWEHKMDLDAQGYAYTKRQGYAVQQSSDGGYLIAGGIIHGDQSDACLIRTDSTGTVVWLRLFSGAEWDCFYSVEQTTDGCYILAGYTEVESLKHGYIVKTDALGNEEWSYVLETPGSQAKAVRQTEDGGYIVTGYQGSSLYLLQLDNEGYKQWSRAFGLAGGNMGYAVDQTGDGGYVAAGSTGAGVYLVKTDGSGQLDWEVVLGSAGDTGYSVRQTVDGGYIVSGSKNSNLTDAYLVKVTPASKVFFGVSSPNVLANGTVLVYATVLDDNGQRDTSGVADVKVQISGSDEYIELNDLGLGGDFGANDGVYSDWIQTAGADPVLIELLVNDINIERAEVNIAQEMPLPLIAMTDLQILYNQFKDTGMDPEEDLDGNKIPDYYDLLDRLNQYAANHNGVVVDLTREITKFNGYANDYGTLSYDFARFDQGELIDEYIRDVGNATWFRNLAIIGDDEVVPSFRRTSPDASMQEFKYGNVHYGNPTLLDSSSNLIITDMPYGSYDNTNPDFVLQPRIDAGVGRIFAKRPGKLVELIDAYEGPIVLVPGERKAVIFGLHNELVVPGRPDVEWPAAINASVMPVLERTFDSQFEPPLPYQAGLYYYHDGDIMDWSPEDVTEAINAVDITMFWSHMSHTVANTRNNRDLSAFDYDLMPESPGHVLLSTGCHSGYSVAYNSSENDFTPYENALVKSLLEKKVTHFAPTVYGIGAEPSLAYHDLIQQRFLNNLLNAKRASVGEAMVATYHEYWAHTNPAFIDNTATYSTYGMALYGLPTQPLQYTANNLLLSAAVPEAAGSTADDGAEEFGFTAAGTGINQLTVSGVQVNTVRAASISVPVDIPHFKVSVDSVGEASFEIPYDGSFLVQAFAPRLPLITKSYLLPQGTEVSDVSLVNQVTSVHPEPVNIKKAIPINRTFGPLEGSFNIPNPYPQEVFWWETYAEDGGMVLSLSIVPLQYNPDTQEATLYNHLEFRVDYTSATSGTTIDAVEVNNGRSLQTGLPDVPVSVTITSPVEQDLTMWWSIKDRSGLTLDSGQAGLALIGGANRIPFDTDTMNWTPGPKDLSIAISGEAVLDTRTVQLPVGGIGIKAELHQSVYEPADTTGALNIEVMNERGAGIAGLESGNFSLTIDGAAVGDSTLLAVGDGHYSLQFPLVGLSEARHLISLTCRDSSGLTETEKIILAIQSDTKPPMVTQTVPVDNGTGVGSGDVVSITFNEIVQASSEFNSMTIETGGLPVAYTPAINYATLTLTPENALEKGAIYKVTIPPGAVKDLADNELAFEYSFQFVTRDDNDMTPPVVVSTQPQEGDINVPATVRVMVTFNESVQGSVYYNDLTWFAGATEVPFDPVVSGTSLILDPLDDVPYNSPCTVTIPAGALSDQMGNDLEESFTVSFTTERGPDSEPPVISRSIPGDGEIGVLPDALFSIQFDESVIQGVYYDRIDWIANEEPVAFIPDIQNSTVTLTPEAPLPYNALCAVSVPAGAVKDLAGNDLAMEARFTFSTGNFPDINPPEVQETIPADRGMGVLPQAVINVYFSESVRESVYLADITCQSVVGEVYFDAAVNGRALYLTPQENLDYAATFTVNIPAGAVRDLAGNELVSAYAFSFTTGDVPDTTPPEVDYTQPTGDAIDIPINTEVKITFNEAVVQQGAAYSQIKIMDGDAEVPYAADIGGKTLTLTPNALGYGTNYQVIIPAGAVADLAGNGLAVGYTFYFQVIDVPTNPDADAVADDLRALIFDVIKGENTAPNNIIANLNLVAGGDNGTTISWSAAPTGWINTGTGAVTRPTYSQGDQAVTLTATITKGDSSAAKAFVLTVKAADLSADEAVALDKEALTWSSIKGTNSAANNVTSNLSLPVSGANGTSISWSAAPTGWINTGTGAVTRPSSNEGDQTVTLTATITKGTASETKSFVLTVKALTSVGGGGVGGGGGGPVVKSPATCSISGRVTELNKNTGHQISFSGLQVYLYPASGSGPANTATTGSDGRYKFESISPGSYKLQFGPANPDQSSYLPEWYNNKRTRQAADVITLKAGDTYTANATMDYPAKPQAVYRYPAGNGVWYRVIIPAGALQDLQGNPLTREYSATFTTGDR